MAAPLSRIKVLELAGLAPAPMAGMILADFGASVIRVDRHTESTSNDRLARGKRSIAVNLKTPQGVDVVKRLSDNSDILIEPFRPGVMEKLGLGPDKLLESNKKLIYARVTGYGQDGPLAQKAGHDINYLALSGLLSMIGRKGEKPLAPLNLIADFAGGSLTCVIGILLALFERQFSGKGQVVDCSMVEGSSYLGSFMNRSKDLFIWRGERGTNVLDSGAPFYDTYRTKDGKYIAVGALEFNFFKDLVDGLGLAEEFPSNFDIAVWPEMRARFTDTFASKTQEEWLQVFSGKDACVAPVLSLDEAALHPHNKARKGFAEGKLPNGQPTWEPKPAPNLSRTPAKDPGRPQPEVGQHTNEVLLQAGYTQSEIASLNHDNIVTQFIPASSL